MIAAVIGAVVIAGGIVIAVLKAASEQPNRKP